MSALVNFPCCNAVCHVVCCAVRPSAVLADLASYSFLALSSPSTSHALPIRENWSRASFELSPLVSG